jgi:hypothetical protein
LGFYLRDFTAHSDGASLADAGVVYSFVHSGLYGHVFIFIIVLFILLLSYFIHLVFRTYVSSCVRGGIKHPKSDLIILGCDKARVV